MIAVKEVIIVEGRYDKNTVLQAVDCTVIETSGFGVFKSEEKADLIRRLAKTRGIIVFTDSDGAGFIIRNHIKGIVNTGVIKHAYIPDIYGKEKRKRSPSKEGKLGVEGMPPDVIIDVLKKAGATFLGQDAPSPRKSGITKADFFELGLTGGVGSSEKRALLLAKLRLPSRMTANSLLDVANALYTRDEFMTLAEEISLQGQQK